MSPAGGGARPAGARHRRRASPRAWPSPRRDPCRSCRRPGCGAARSRHRRGPLERRSSPIGLGAEAQRLLERKGIECAGGQRQARALVLRAVALRLDDQHRRVAAAQRAHVGQPIAERLVAEGEAAVVVELSRPPSPGSRPAGRWRATSGTGRACRDRCPARRNPRCAASPAAPRPGARASGAELISMPCVDGTVSS